MDRLIEKEKTGQQQDGRKEKGKEGRTDRARKGSCCSDVRRNAAKITDYDTPKRDRLNTPQKTSYHKPP